MSAEILVYLGYFIIVIIMLTLLWRITTALDKIGEKLSDMARDLKTISDKKEK